MKHIVAVIFSIPLGCGLGILLAAITYRAFAGVPLIPTGQALSAVALVIIGLLLEVVVVAALSIRPREE